MLPVVLRLVGDTALVGALLFASAGTLAWPRAWVLLAVLMLVRAVGAQLVYRTHPVLLRERTASPMHRDQSGIDKALVLAVLATGFLGLPLIAARDVFRWHVLPQPAPILGAVGLGLFALGWSLKQYALRANAFATVAVRLQSARAHAVADTGVYAIVRHPFYAADPLIFVGLGLWLQSYVAVLCSIVPMSLIVIRIHAEERFLKRQLPGYADYTARVPYRLIPKVW